jgi:alkylhydroperoxidase family enzyme
MPFFPSMPEDATTKHIFIAHPEIYSHWARVSEAILRGPSPLTPAQRELIGAYVSSLNACRTPRNPCRKNSQHAGAADLTKVRSTQVHSGL